MMFYNGFNLIIDIALVSITYLVAHGIGYRKAKGMFMPPF